MKKFIMSLTLFSLLVLAACLPGGEIIDPDNGEETIKLIKSDLAREINPVVGDDKIQTLSQDNTAFATKFYDQIRAQDGNLIFSPLSLSLALSMTLAGAESSTEEGMLTGLQMSLPENELHTAFNALMLAIEDSQDQGQDEFEGDRFQLNIANSIWGQAGYGFKQPFLDTLAQQYDAGIFAVDYVQNPEGARVAINDWVSQETEQKIKELIPSGAIDSLTRLVLANAIYFNGSWLNSFSEDATTQEPFFTLDGTEISADMMKLYGERFLYYRGDNFQALNLPYMSSDFVMTLLVPDQGVFTEFEGGLDERLISEILSSMTFTRVDLEMPKFDFESTINANDPLIALGMGSAFDPKTADFSGITEEEDLMITDVLHKATITVDEKGTEAAAATAVIVGVTSAMPEDPIMLTIDRPFMFFIRHQPTNTILFMGRVVQP
jgi:serpin B